MTVAVEPSIAIVTTETMTAYSHVVVEASLAATEAVEDVEMITAERVVPLVVVVIAATVAEEDMTQRNANVILTIRLVSDATAKTTWQPIALQRTTSSPCSRPRRSARTPAGGGAGSGTAGSAGSPARTSQRCP